MKADYLFIDFDHKDDLYSCPIHISTSRATRKFFKGVPWLFYGVSSRKRREAGEGRMGREGIPAAAFTVVHSEPNLRFIGHTELLSCESAGGNITVMKFLPTGT